jgi:DNA helicase HerA-like ATPase
MLKQSLQDIASVDIFKEGRDENLFIGRPFYLGYEKANILVSDAWKHRAKGIPQGTFLLAFYEGEKGVKEALLLRALVPTKLPTDNDIVSSMIEYYKEGTDISGRAGNGDSSKLDDFTRYEFSFSGLECRVLGSFYLAKRNDGEEVVEFGADIENFYSANNYSVYKATDKVLKRIVNQREDEVIAGNENEFRIGAVRYSSSRRFQLDDKEVEVYISPKDFIGKRTALFGMTRTGKSNTVKKIIEATAEISKKSPNKTLPNKVSTTNNQQQKALFPSFDDKSPFTKEGAPTFPVGQIIFDINGEYANPNLQDEGTAIYELYKNDVTRYSVLEKPNFKVMRVNFYKELEAGFELIRSYLESKSIGSDYVDNFSAVDLPQTENTDGDFSTKNRSERIVAAYLCCLYKAGFQQPAGFTVKFTGNKEINKEVGGEIDPSKGISLAHATSWFEWVWKNYEENTFFKDYEKKEGHEWADDDLKSLLIFLSGYKKPGEKNSVSGYKKIRTRELHELHTNTSTKSFSDEIPELLRSGKIVIVDLSQGSETVQTIYSEKICRSIFNDSMGRFIQNLPNNFIQFYFEEAHNLFPKKEDKDLSSIYNRLAKEGAKLYLGMIYATQEVSSISANILKNTQNWFIAHLNNEDELKELRKYYDFSDFVESLLKFSAGNDKGFVRMKTYTNPFVVPVQVDRFLANRK